MDFQFTIIVLISNPLKNNFLMNISALEKELFNPAARD